MKLAAALESQPVVKVPPHTGSQTSWRLSLRSWSGKGFFALLDQGLISGSNFLVGILLARQLLAKEYGAYALAFEVFLFLSVLYGSLMLEPMSVLGTSIYRNQLREYLGTLLRVHVLVSVLTLVGVGSFAAAVHVLNPSSDFPWALLGVGIATPAVLLYWLARRAFYVRLSSKGAVAGAAIYFGVLLCGLAIVYKLKLLTPLSAFLLMAAGAAVSGPLMLRWLKPRIRDGGGAFPGLRDVIRSHWIYGRWAVISAVVIWFSGAMYYPMLGTFSGLADAGKLKALMNFASPVGQVFAALSLLSLPYASRVHHDEGAAGANRLVWRLAGLYGGGTVLYWALIILLQRPLVHYLYHGKYAEVTYLLPWIALGSILRISATAQSVVLRAMQKPALVCVAYSACSVIALLAGVPFTWLFGLKGVAIAMVLSSLGALAVAVFMVRRTAASHARKIDARAEALVAEVART